MERHTQVVKKSGSALQHSSRSRLLPKWLGPGAETLREAPVRGVVLYLKRLRASGDVLARKELSNSVRRAEEALRNLVRHFGSEHFSLNHRMMVVKAGIDARVFDLVEQFCRAGKAVRGMRD